MTNTKTTKRALFTSTMSLLLCVAMLIGSTFAWFTDSATTGVNSIVAGNLDLVLEYTPEIGGTNWTEVDANTPVFEETTLWEPGYTQVAYFKLTNNGNLAFDAEISTNGTKIIEGKNKDGDVIDLSKYLQFGIVNLGANADAFADRKAARAAIEEPINFGDNAQYASLAPGETTVFAMVVWMPEETGNEANHNGTNVPSIKFGITVVAKQSDVEAESDSYGSNYDEDAEYKYPDKAPELEDVTTAPGNMSELKEALQTALTGGSAGGTITIKLDKSFDAANNWTTINGEGYSGVNKVVIDGGGNFITNLNAPLLGKIFAGDSGSIEIKNLTIKNSVIEVEGNTNEGVGVFLNTADATNEVKFTNCILDNVKITNTNSEGYLGGFLGYSSSQNLTFTNCKVNNCTFNGKKDIGAFVGYTMAKLAVDGGSVTGNTITSSNASSYRVGAIAGTVYSRSASAIDSIAVSGNTVTQDNSSGTKTHDYVGRILSDVYVDGTNIKK